MKISSQARDLTQLTRDLSRCCQSKEEQLFKRFDLSCAEGRLLLCVADFESTTASAVTKCLGISKGRLSPLVDHLVQKGLLTRREVAADRRTNDLAVTAHGRVLAAEVAECQTLFHEQLLKRFDKEERTQLLTMLRRLRLELEDLRGQLTS